MSEAYNRQKTATHLWLFKAGIDAFALDSEGIPLHESLFNALKAEHEEGLRQRDDVRREQVQKHGSGEFVFADFLGEDEPTGVYRLAQEHSLRKACG